MKLRTRITLALVAVAVVPLIFTVLRVTERGTELLWNAALNFQAATGDAAARAVREQLETTRTELLSIGSVLADHKLKPEERIRLARGLLLGARNVHRVAIFGPDGAHLDTMSADEAEVGLEAPSALSREVRSVAESDRRAYLRPELTDGRFALPLVLPIRRHGEAEPYLYVWTAMGLSPLRQTMAEVSGRHFQGIEDRVYLIDDTLRVLAHAQAAELGLSRESDPAVAEIAADPGLLGKNIALAGKRVTEGGTMLVAVTPIPELRWGVVVELERDEAYAPIATVRSTALVVGSIAVVVALVLSLLFGRRLGAPLAALARAARRIAGGDFEARVEDNRTDEVGQLGRAFNVMAQDLDTSRRALVKETRLRTDLSRYLSSDVVDRVMTDDDALALGGQRRDITVIFADVVDFTPLAEELDPETVVGTLNQLFTFLTEIVFKHGGIVDKFMGDCVMAVFGAPYARGDEALRAMRAAEEMLRWLETGNAAWSGIIGRDLQLGIGVASGVVLAGNLGSERRMEYTVVGDVVNIAARLEMIAAPGQVLMDDTTARRVSAEFDCVPVGNRQLTGRSSEVAVYSLAE